MTFNPDIGRATQFRKGQSGNAGGRPKSRLLSEALRNRLAQTVDGDPTGRTFAECIADNMVQIALSEGTAAVHAATEIADRIEGRPPQHVQVSDFAADLQRRSDAELQFFLDNNRWPTDEELMLLRLPAEQTEM